MSFSFLLKVNTHLPPNPQLNKFYFMAGMISKYMEFDSDNSPWEGGGVEPPKPTNSISKT